MKHYVDKQFWRLYKKLEPGIRAQARKQHNLLKRDPSHPSLHFKSVNNKWSVRVNDDYRAVAVKSGDDFIWYWIGNHRDYERIIRAR